MPMRVSEQRHKDVDGRAERTHGPEGYLSLPAGMTTGQDMFAYTSIPTGPMCMHVSARAGVVSRAGTRGPDICAGPLCGVGGRYSSDGNIQTKPEQEIHRSKLETDSVCTL